MKIASLRRIAQYFSGVKQKKTQQSSAAAKKIKELFGNVDNLTNHSEVTLKMEKQILRRSRQTLEQIQKEKNYHYYEYYRGEDFIENIPYAPTYSYTVRDKIQQEKDLERRAIEELQPISNHIAKGKIIKEKINAYHDKQKKYQIQEFQKYLSKYPGTVKGPKPEDDWEAYRAYGLKKIPKILLDQIHEEQAEQRARDQLVEEIDEQDVDLQPKIHSPSSILSYMSKDRDLIDLENKGTKEGGHNDQFQIDWAEQQLIDDHKTEVPMIPHTNFENYQHFMNHWMSWINFRNYYIGHNVASHMQKFYDKVLKLSISMDDDPSTQYIDLPANIPSLSRYYRTLPKSIQDHPGLKDIYLGLEYTSPDFTYEEKEDAINMTCPLLLPFDDISIKVLTDYTARSRQYATPFLFDKIFTISPQFTWDLKSFLQQIRRQQLRGESTSQNKDVKFPEPPEVHKQWEEGCANLPVDFYDNSDGFWDSLISERLKRYDDFKPMLKTRKHFSH